MWPWRVTFETPVFLWLLAGLPWLWWVGWRPLAALGSGRRWMALVLRTLVYLLVVAALSGIQAARISDRLTVLYLLDQSESIPAAQRRLMLEYVKRAVQAQRHADRNDRAGIIVFAREASIEIPPFDDDIPPLSGLESYLGRYDATSLEAALKLAQAALPEDSARRVVIVTDGNENLGDARRIGARLADAGIGIDVVPIELEASGEVVLEKIDLPSEVRVGQPVQARVVTTAYLPADRPDARIRGTLRVVRRIGGDSELLAEEKVELKGGSNVATFQHTIDQPAPYTYEAEFIPEGTDADALQQNNRATAYTYVRGQGRVLLIEDFTEPGEYTRMVDRLRSNEIEVVVQQSNALFNSLAELQAYDAVILAGVPRSSGEDADSITSFSDEQIEMLTRYVQQLGCGVLMIGGSNGLGAGGWTGTKLEEAMPVEFRVRNAKVRAIGALAMIMHASELAQGNAWQKVVARQALETLGPDDFCGIVEYGNAGDRWLWGGQKGMLPVGPNLKTMLGALSRMEPGDMPDFGSGMQLALQGLNPVPAALKHCIIISDGDPTPPSAALLQAFSNASIKVSTVAIGTHGPAGHQVLQNIASATGGKYYVVKDPRALPRIYQREARRVARPVIFEPPGGVQPQVVSAHPLLDGLGEELPTTLGFVLTQVKDNPLAQVLIRSPLPDQPENQTILAVWQYGLGRTAVLTTDAGYRWAAAWNEWQGYDKFYSQLIRWLMRPAGEQGNFQLATQARNGQIEVVLTALDPNQQFLNFLEIAASALDPRLKPLPLSLRQVAPGRYVGNVTASEPGNYFVTVMPGPGIAPISAGVTVPYSDEYRARETNQALLRALSELKPKDGEPGVLMAPLSAQQMDQTLATDAFRSGVPPARSLKDVWPWVALLSAGLFWADCAVRRVAIDWGALVRKIWPVTTSAAEHETTARLDQLRRQKDSVADELARRRTAARFEAEEPLLDDSLTVTAAKDARRPREQPPTKDDAEEGPSYTERLLAAKRAAKRGPPQPPDANRP